MIVDLLVFISSGQDRGGFFMATNFERISGNDDIFNHKEYVSDSLIFNAIESDRNDEEYSIFSDHKNVIIMTSPKGPRVWLWTSSAIKDDTNKLIDISRFIRDQKIKGAEIYLKQDVSGNFSDLYALTTLEINYTVKDEFSLAVYTYNNEPVEGADNKEPDKGEKIIRIDKDNENDVKLLKDFYTKLKDEFRWHEKFDRKINEYLNAELYALVKDGEIIADAVIGGGTDDYMRIKSVAVLADKRRCGFGYKICSYAVNRIKDRSLTPVLYTHIGNVSAVALWSKVGFRMKDKLYLLKIENN